MSGFPEHLERKYGYLDTKLGKGSYGTVYQTSKRYAVKKLKGIDGAILDSGLQEAALMQLVDDKYCMRALDVGINQQDIFIVMELGQRIPKTYMPEDQLRSTFLDICFGIAGLHSFDVLHLDLKPQNCLKVKNKVKLADFGLSRYQTCVRGIKKRVYTLTWRPPEILLEFAATRASDVWAAGIMLMTWLLGKYPFDAEDESLLKHLIFVEFGTPTEATWPGVTNSRKYPNTQRSPAYRLCSQISDPAGRDLVKKMLEVNPHRRPTIFEVLQHPFFSGMNIPINLDPPGCRDNLIEHVIDSELSGRSCLTVSRYLRVISNANEERSSLYVSSVAFGLGVTLFNWCIRHLSIKIPDLTVLACMSLGASMLDKNSPDIDSWSWDWEEMTAEIRRICRARKFQFAITSPVAIAYLQAHLQGDVGLFSVLESVIQVLMTTTLPWTMSTVKLGDLIYETAFALRYNHLPIPIKTRFIPNPMFITIQNDILIPKK